MDETPFAVALTYVPSEGRCYHTPFGGEAYDDPLTAAHIFRESEEERGDFPGSLWAVTGNEAAVEIRKATLLRSIGIGD